MFSIKIPISNIANPEEMIRNNINFLENPKFSKKWCIWSFLPIINECFLTIRIIITVKKSNNWIATHHKAKLGVKLFIFSAGLSTKLNLVARG